MPLTKSAIKKQRVDRKRTATNVPVRGRVKSTIKTVQAKPTAAGIRAFASAVDHAVAANLLSRRAAARMKSRLSKRLHSKLATSPFAK